MKRILFTRNHYAGGTEYKCLIPPKMGLVVMAIVAVIALGIVYFWGAL